MHCQDLRLQGVTGAARLSEAVLCEGATGEAGGTQPQDLALARNEALLQLACISWIVAAVSQCRIVG